MTAITRPLPTGEGPRDAAERQKEECYDNYHVEGVTVLLDDDLRDFGDFLSACQEAGD